MVIWSGWGFLIIVFFVIGSVAGGMFSSYTGLGFGGVIGGVIAAFLNYLVVKASGPGRALIDPATGQPVLLKKNNSLFFIPMRFFTPLFLVGGIVIGVGGMIVQKNESLLSQTYPGKSVFDTIDKTIDSTKSSTSKGNNPNAIKAAEQFEMLFKTAQKLSFYGGAEKYETRRFPTYCHQNKDGVVIICQVPGFRKYKDAEVKEALHEIAWDTAKIAVKEMPGITEESLLIVGLRGLVIYDSVKQGKVGDEQGVGDDDQIPLYEAFDPDRDL